MNPENRVRPFFAERNAVMLPLCTILAVACGLRVWMVFFSKATWYNTDTSLYLDMAKGILEGHPVANAPNGFPLIIALVERLCGPTLLPTALVTLNVVASSLMVLLCYGIGAALASARAGLVAAALIAIWPNQLNYMRQILSETPATFLLVFGIYLVIRRRNAVGGIALTAASLIRSTLTPVVLLVFLWIILCERKKVSILLYAAGVGVVCLFNFILIGLHVVAPSTNAGYNLLIAIQSSSTRGIRFETDAFTPEQHAHPLRVYLAFAANSPGTFLAQRLSAFWELWGPWPSSGGGSLPRSTLARLLIGLRFPVLVLAMAELVRKLRSAERWLLAIPVIVLTVLHTVYFSTPRFSYSAEPFVMVLCGLLLARVIWPAADPAA